MSLKFDTTINVGHVVSVVMLCAAVVVGWNTLDKRVLELEVRARNQEQRDAAQDQYIREAVSDTKRAIERIADRLERNLPRGAL
ncbi:MAG TPA: hypothetical protein VNT52_01020 [Acidimicrobiales bacterium]|nr:hypothetical protein [Acidimicrobiales bacterium]